MFNFMAMADDYEQRKVSRYEEGAVIIDTAMVTDGKQPFETAVAHPLYNNGKFIIVEAYDTKEDAQKGHDEWVKIMTEGELPESLQDCVNAGISQIGEVVGIQMIFPRKEVK